MRRPSRRAGRGREALLEGQKGLRGTPRGLGGVRKPSRRAGKDPDELLEG